MRSRHSAAILQMMDLAETIAPDLYTYLEIAVRLGNDPEWRHQFRQKVYASHDRVYGDRGSVRALEDFYRRVVTGRIPTISERCETSRD